MGRRFTPVPMHAAQHQRPLALQVEHLRERGEGHRGRDCQTSNIGREELSQPGLLSRGFGPAGPQQDQHDQPSPVHCAQLGSRTHH